MAPSLEQRKDILQTSDWQNADVVVGDGMRPATESAGRAIPLGRAFQKGRDDATVLLGAVEQSRMT